MTLLVGDAEDNDEGAVGFEGVSSYLVTWTSKI